MEEVFGESNHISTITVQKTYGFSSDAISNVCDYLIWFGRQKQSTKVRSLYTEKPYILGEANVDVVTFRRFYLPRGECSREIGHRSTPRGVKTLQP
jgi:adenine-specific DNA-methyltransferase